MRLMRVIWKHQTWFQHCARSLLNLEWNQQKRGKFKYLLYETAAFIVSETAYGHELAASSERIRPPWHPFSKYSAMSNFYSGFDPYQSGGGGYGGRGQTPGAYGQSAGGGGTTRTMIRDLAPHQPNTVQL